MHKLPFLLKQNHSGLKFYRIFTPSKDLKGIVLGIQVPS